MTETETVKRVRAPRAKVLLEMPPALCASMDSVLEQLELSRSAFIRLAIREKLQRVKLSQP